MPMPNNTMAVDVDTPEAKAVFGEALFTDSSEAFGTNSTVGGSFNTAAAAGARGGTTEAAAQKPSAASFFPAAQKPSAASFFPAAATPSAYEAPSTARGGGTTEAAAQKPSAASFFPAAQKPSAASFFPAAATPSAYEAPPTPAHHAKSPAVTYTPQPQPHPSYHPNTDLKRSLNYNTPRHPIAQDSHLTAEKMKSALKEAGRGQSVIEIESEKRLASFGSDTEGKKLDAGSLMDYREGNVHPLVGKITNRRTLFQYLRNIADGGGYGIKDEWYDATKSWKHGRHFIGQMENQKDIVQNEQRDFSTILENINQYDKLASEKTTDLIEQCHYEKEGKVQELEKQKEELDRQKEEIDRQKEGIDRKIEEARSECKEKEENLLHNQKRNTDNARKYEKLFVDRNEVLKKESAARLAIPLAWEDCDKKALALLKLALDLHAPSSSPTNDETMEFEVNRDELLRLITAIEENDKEALTSHAVTLLYWS